MLFCSSVFFVFFIVFLLLWYATPKKWHHWLIIIASLYFYGYWNWSYTLLPLGLTLGGFFSIKWIDNATGPQNKKFRLALCIAVMLIPLFIFKYLNFFLRREIITVGLPLGISYITFTLIAYLIDVAKKDYPAESHFSWLLAYVTYFPQLIAGPILRPRELLPQLKQNLQPTNLVRWQAVTIFTAGLVKKLIFADQIKPFVDSIYSVKGTPDALQSVIGFYLFPAQIYCDFSGYTDMAIGLALFFGIQLPMNFNRPFLSCSTTEVWRRWQITLSFWLRDYLYIPIVKKYNYKYIKPIAKFITLTLCGLWHGANWTYVVWGSFNGILLIVESLFKNTQWSRRLPKPIKILTTFHLFAFGVVFVRSRTIDQAWDILRSLFFWQSFTLGDVSPYAYPLMLCSLTYFSHHWDCMDCLKEVVERSNRFLLTASLSVLWFLAVILNVLGGGSSKFIYFDF